MRAIAEMMTFATPLAATYAGFTPIDEPEHFVAEQPLIRQPCFRHITPRAEGHAAAAIYS